jgi:lipopolysaccharide transport system permease protein
MRYSNFILNSIKQETIAGYKNYSLGNLWLLIQPLTMMSIYILVFGHLFQQKLSIDLNSSIHSYTIYICSGLIFWNFFVDLFSRYSNIYIKYAFLLKKVAIPMYAFFIIEASSALFSFLIFSSIFITFLFFTHNHSIINFYVLFSTIPIIFLLAFSLGYTLSILNIFVRDVGSAVGIFLQIWFWATPIIYPANIIPERFYYLFALNPFVSIINNIRFAFGFHKDIELNSAAIYPILLSLIFIFLSMLLLRYNKKYMNDFL